MPVIVRSEIHDVDARLAELALDRNILIEVVRAAVAAHANWHEDDPPPARGTDIWRYGTRQFRIMLKPKGWKKDDSGNFCTIVNHDLRVRITVLSGDEGVGIPTAQPQNRSKKGIKTEKAIAVNSSLLPGIEWPISVRKPRMGMVEEYETWHLLVYISEESVRAELTLLSEIDGGFFSDCRERLIVLGSGEWDLLEIKLNPDDQPPDVDFEVAPRANGQVMFNPARLSLARRRRGLTKKALAEALGFDQKTVIRYENGEVTPPSENLSIISKILNFPEQFFLGEDIDEPQLGTASFRSLSTMLAGDRDAALAAGALAFLLSDWVDARFSLPECQLPEFKEDTDPEIAALNLRQSWGIGEKAIPNLIHLAESKGIRVFSLNEETHTIDAFSMWRRDTPYIFLNSQKTAERGRFDAAHEIGHLVLHRHGAPAGRKAEEQANQFASAFLMPESHVRSKITHVLSLQQLVQAKKVWGVSVSALNYRLHKLKIISDWQYRRFYIQLNENYGVNEPNGIARERSLAWEKILQHLWKQRFTKFHLAEALSLPVSEVESLLFKLTNMQSIEGGGGGTRSPQGELRAIQK